MPAMYALPLMLIDRSSSSWVRYAPRVGGTAVGVTRAMLSRPRDEGNRAAHAPGLTRRAAGRSIDERGRLAMAEPRFRYCRTADGVNIGFWSIGQGDVIVD